MILILRLEVRRVIHMHVRVFFPRLVPVDSECSCHCHPCHIKSTRLVAKPTDPKASRCHPTTPQTTTQTVIDLLVSGVSVSNSHTGSTFLRDSSILLPYIPNICNRFHRDLQSQLCKTKDAPLAPRVVFPAPRLNCSNAKLF